MRTSRKEQREEARVWLKLAKQMGEDAQGLGLCSALGEMRECRGNERVDQVIQCAVIEQGRLAYLDDRHSGPDWDRCLFACLMAAVANAGDMDDFRKGDFTFQLFGNSH